MPAPLFRIWRAALAVSFAICMTAYLLGEQAHTDPGPRCLSRDLYLGTPLYRGPSGIPYLDGEHQRLCLTDTTVGAMSYWAGGGRMSWRGTARAAGWGALGGYLTRTLPNAWKVGKANKYSNPKYRRVKVYRGWRFWRNQRLWRRML